MKRLLTDAECARYGLRQMHPDDEENKPLELFRIYERILMYDNKNSSYTETPSVGGLKAAIETKRLFNRKFRQLVKEIVTSESESVSEANRPKDSNPQATVNHPHPITEG